MFQNKRVTDFYLCVCLLVFYLFVVDETNDRVARDQSGSVCGWTAGSQSSEL